MFFSPSIDSIWYGVFIFNLPSFSNFFTISTLCSTPLNSFLLCIKVTSEVFDIRPWTREILEKSGFNICDILKNHVMIEDKQIDSILYQKILRD